jgi:hypothetical protein
MARDAERLVIFQDLRLSLEQYYDEYGFYPPNLFDGNKKTGHITNPLYEDNFPFKAAGIDGLLTDEDIGNSLILNPNGQRFMKPLYDAGLWNRTMPNNSKIMTTGLTNELDKVQSTAQKGLFGRQPNGTIFGDRPDLCGGFIAYRNKSGWSYGNPNTPGVDGNPELGPQVYFLSMLFERRDTFDGWTAADKDSVQFDLTYPDHEYYRTAIQQCPSGNALYVVIHHCPGTWVPRPISGTYPAGPIANNQRAYPDPIPMFDCQVDSVNVY